MRRVKRPYQSASATGLMMKGQLLCEVILARRFFRSLWEKLSKVGFGSEMIDRFLYVAEVKYSVPKTGEIDG